MNMGMMVTMGLLKLVDVEMGMWMGLLGVVMEGLLSWEM